MTFELPEIGFVFWLVGNGDSTTIVVKKDVVIQLDLHQLKKAEEDGDDHSLIIDELERLLPEKDGKPYLSVFALTHPDKDHIGGFEDFLARITIGEIWFTPRIFREYNKDLCDDAVVFKKEVKRRREITIKKGGEPDSGNKIRIIGHDDILNNDKYKGFPEECRTIPGNPIYRLDGKDYSEDEFEAFIHAPFKDDSSSDRNDTSLAMQVSLWDGDKCLKGLFLGDLKYPTIKKIFDTTKEMDRAEKLEYNCLLASHHCSKSVMYFKSEGEEEETLKQDILDEFEEAALDGAYIIASCESDFTDEKGKNPPHAKARDRYEEIVDSGKFLCTHEHSSNATNPEPIKFELEEEGISYIDPVGEISESKDSNSLDLADSILAARGNNKPPEKPVGFG